MSLVLGEGTDDCSGLERYLLLLLLSCSHVFEVLSIGTPT